MYFALKLTYLSPFTLFWPYSMTQKQKSYTFSSYMKKNLKWRIFHVIINGPTFNYLYSSLSLSLSCYKTNFIRIKNRVVVSLFFSESFHVWNQKQQSLIHPFEFFVSFKNILGTNINWVFSESKTTQILMYPSSWYSICIYHQIQRDCCCPLSLEDAS